MVERVWARGDEPFLHSITRVDLIIITFRRRRSQMFPVAAMLQKRLKIKTYSHDYPPGAYSYSSRVMMIGEAMKEEEKEEERTKNDGEERDRVFGERSCHFLVGEEEEEEKRREGGMETRRRGNEADFRVIMT